MNKTVLVCAAASLMLGACGGSSVKETLGIDRRAPDEFRVVSRPPLSVPPQFELRPPGSASDVANPAQRDKAQSLVLGDAQPAKTGKKGAKSTGGPTAADAQFLQKAGASQADPNVKRALDEKKMDEQLKKEEKGWFDRITVFPESKEPVVKADAEAKRIEQNKQAGKPVNEGKTPESGGGEMSTLERWFGDW